MDEVAFDGRRKRIVWASDASGKTLGKEYFDGLRERERVKLEALFERMGDMGELRNREKFRHEGDGVYVFKSSQRRLACFFDSRDVVITHGFTKKRDAVPKTELERAKRLRDVYQARKAR